MAKYTVYGLPGVYNATPLSLNDGDGVALAVTQNGYLVVVNADGSSIGGGTEYTDGGTPPTHPKGGTIIFDNGGTWQHISAANPLPVTPVTLPVGHNIIDSGTITANAGTNLNTSALALESGGNLDDIDAALDNIVAQEATTSGVKGLTAFGAVTTNAPSYTNAKSDALSLDTSGLLRISLKDTPANTNKLLVTPDSVALPANQSVNVSQINGVTVSMGSGIMGTGVQRIAIASDNDALTVKQATGTNLHVVVDSAPSTAVTNVGTFAVQATPVTQVDTFMLGGVNVKEINAVTPLMGNGVTGTGSLRVTIASDNTAFAVNATLSAETTKVIGVTRSADGAGNLLTTATAEPVAGDRGLEVREVDTGFVSTNNSSTVTLTSGSVFTGTADTITNYASVTVTVISNVASATDGLSMQQSSDGTNWDVLDVYTVPAATGKTFGVQVTAKFFRVVYTNGGTGQASFRLQTILHKYMPNASSVRPGDGRSLQNDMQEVIAYGANYDGTNLNLARSIINATNSTGTGILAVGNVAQFDDVAPTSITENQFGNVRMSANRNQYQTIRDAAGNERGVNVTAANELNVLPTQKDTFAAAAAFTITLASLANSTAGVGRQSTLVTSNTAKSALIMVKFTVGTTPVANTLVYVYLIRGDGSINDDNAGASDAGITIINSPLLGTILVPAATSNTAYYGMFDTKFLGSLGPTFGIAVVNSTNVTANSTGGNFTAEYTLIT